MAQTSTWFTTPGADCIAQSYRGTQPGRQLADVLFNVSFRPILVQIDAELKSSPFSIHVRCPEDRPFSSAVPQTAYSEFANSATVAYVDDAAFIVHIDTSDLLHDAARYFYNLVHDATVSR
eukprot:12286332-Karenia_brevis.AAC.1